MELADLVRTNLHLAGLVGRVTDHGDHIVVRTPDNPGYYHGNYILLPGPPTELDRWLDRFETFGAEVGHCCLVWSGSEASPRLLEEAKTVGFESDSGIAMALDAPPAATDAWPVRRLNLADHWDAIVALDTTVDTAERDGSAVYRRFKEQIRATRRTWIERGHATWWGAFDGDTLVGQCGFVACEPPAIAGADDPSRAGRAAPLGRLQSVETHPGWRRQGVCSALITTVARDGFARLGCRRILLEAENDGPALGLYRRLGFVATGRVRSLLRGGEGMRVRAERAGDHAGVRSLVIAAFAGSGSPEGPGDGTGEARLIDELRDRPGTISLVAERSGALLGHILFTPVTVGRVRSNERGGPAVRSQRGGPSVRSQRGGPSVRSQRNEADPGWPAIALGPMAVRPARQRRGVGSALVREGLRACAAAGHDVCFVLGHPEYYPRFGFRPAPPLGLTCRWPVPDEVFMVHELEPGALAGRTGRVVYDPAFDAV